MATSCLILWFLALFLIFIVFVLLLIGRFFFNHRSRRCRYFHLGLTLLLLRLLHDKLLDSLVWNYPLLKLILSSLIGLGVLMVYLWLSWRGVTYRLCNAHHIYGFLNEVTLRWESPQSQKLYHTQLASQIAQDFSFLLLLIFHLLLYLRLIVNISLLNGHTVLFRA